MGSVKMVGAHNTVDVTVECQVHMGGCVGFFRKGGCWYLQNTIGMWGALPCVPGMVNPGDAQRHVGGFFAIREPNGAYNTVDTNVGAYNAVCVRAVVEHCFP